MKLLSIRMNNVRRFTQPVEILDIGPGLNVLATPNEQGKSTLFDALHALFFFEAKSWKQKEAASLVPHAGGNPEVSAQIEIDGRSYRVSKVFSSRTDQRQVTVHRDGHLFKQAEEAEDWIRNLIKPPKDGGPAGLLWVRQGVTTLQAGKEDDTLAARRDLLSSVAGEIEDITGGRHMEKTRATLKEDLERYLTKSGSTKKHGPLWEAEQAVVDLEGQKEDLQGKVSQLRALLTERRELHDEKSGLIDTEAVKERHDALDSAQALLKSAETFLDDQAKADKAAQTAQLVLDAHQDRVKAIDEQLTEFRKARSSLDELEEKVTSAKEQLADAKSDLDKARTAEEKAREEQTSAEQTRDAVQAAESGRKGAERRRELAKRLEEALCFSEEAASVRKIVDASPSARQMERLELAWQELDLLRRAREASAAAITLSVEPGQQDRVTLDGAPLEPGHRKALPEGGDITIAGVGAIRVHPAEQRDAATLDDAQDEFDAALEATCYPTLQDARQADKKRKTAEGGLRDANAQLNISAPDGIQVLKDEISVLPESEPEVEHLPSQADTDAAFRAARIAHDQAQADREGTRATFDVKHGDVRELRVRRDEAKNRLSRASDTVEDPSEKSKELTKLQAKTPELEKALEDARQHVQKLAADAPDLSLAQAGAQRAQNVADQADSRMAEIGNRLSALEALISHDADLAVEEKLREVDGKLETAKDHSTQVQAEVKVLQRLDAALSEAQKQAHDAYIGPIRNELRPLLRMVLPGAELTLDADSVLPTGLSRPEGEDTYDQLSGGTQEQIALLIRLAFARLLARSGTPPNHLG